VKQQTITFRELVDREYRQNGFTLKGALAQIHNGSGVSLGTIGAAYKGTCIQGRSAKGLGDWAKRVHKVELDVVAMVTAPTRKREVA